VSSSEEQQRERNASPQWIPLSGTREDNKAVSWTSLVSVFETTSEQLHLPIQELEMPN
jgi:hypothetical protein